MIELKPLWIVLALALCFLIGRASKYCGWEKRRARDGKVYMLVRPE